MTELDPLDVELAGTTLIEASAGTGKTHTITTLFVRLLIERPLAVGDILVVTYTNAAAAELRRKVRDRVRQALAAVERGSAPDDLALDALIRRREAHRVEDTARLRAALLGFDEAAIFTIHGFCQRVLQEHAFASGIAFDTELSTDQTALVDDVVRDFWALQLAEAPEETIRALQRNGVTLENLAALAKKVALHRDVPVLPADVADVAVDAAVAQWRSAYAEAAAAWQAQRDAIVVRLRAALPGLYANSYSSATVDAWVSHLDALFAGGGDPPIPEPGVKAVAAFCARQLAARTKKQHAPPSHPFFDLCDRLDAAHAAVAAALAARTLRLQRALVDFARAELRRRKEAANTQFFDDLIHRLADALAGDGAEVLAERLRQRHPVALIDEFQDTDHAQYAIFRRIYHRAAGTALFLIGDPKQSIYAFRGADVFAYLRAKRDAGERAHTLSASWRSDASYLDAVNAIFGVSDPFLVRGIELTPMRMAPPRAAANAGDWPAFQILQLVRPPGALLKKDDARRQSARGAAREIVRLLRAGPLFGGAPVRPRDIAVLCRTNDQAWLMQDALRGLGVHSVVQGDASVFDSRQADELQRVLAALAEPGDGAALRSALATSILGVDAGAMLALQNDEAAWEGWAARLQRWHERWVERSFMAAFRQLLDECEVPRRLLALPDGERAMTNLLHLAELLQRAAAEGRDGPLAMVEWLAEMRFDATHRAGAVGDTAQIRLESDESALTLLTIHKSKGLEWPVVFVPFAWDGLLLLDADKRCPLFHGPEPERRLMLDLGSPDLEAHKGMARDEARAESLRLLYVALTRARHHCTVVWGAAKDAENAALGYLVHRAADTASPDAAAAAASARIKRASDDELLADLRAVAARAPSAIEVAALSLAPIERYREDQAPSPPLRARAAQRHLDLLWRTSSFTSLAAGGGRLPVPAEEGIDRDELVEAADDVAVLPAVPGVFDFPGGRRPGLLVHKLLELIDGRQSAGEVRTLIAGLLPGYGIDPEWVETLQGWVADVLATPLAGGPAPFRLRDVDPRRRLAEVEFTCPVADEAAGALSATRLARPFAAAAGWADYAERLRRLPFAPLRGYLRGFIDLVCEHAGRWYVLDYKSNHLGTHADDYRPARLAPVMEHHHYVLQYHLYTVAVHRYLQQRLPGYDYARHFGGVYYLFVRGMAPRHPAGSGIFFDRPAPALIEALSAALERPAGGDV